MENTNAKSCGTCKHFEPSSEWRRGWCRNTLLYAPSQSHLVQSEELDCSRGAKSFWEAATVRPQVNAGQQDVKLPTFENPLKLFAPAFAGPAFSGAGAANGNMMFASSGSGGGGYDDDDYAYDDDFGFDDPGAPEEEEPRRRPQSNRTRRTSGRANADGGRSRSTSVQPEERYWTDYLRIALPVIGIILMLGVLWIWASSLLGGDDNDVNPEPTDTVGLVQTQPADPNEVNTEPNNASTPPPNQDAPPVNTETNTGEIPISNQTTPAANNGGVFNPLATEPPVEGGDNQTSEEAPPADGETTTEEEPPADTGEITIDSRVAITDVVNIRPSAGTTEEPIGEGAVGEEGTVISGPEEADGFVWWELVFDDGSYGYIAEDFLEVVP